jgi:hypothetical protein
VVPELSLHVHELIAGGEAPVAAGVVHGLLSNLEIWCALQLTRTS